MLQAVLVVVDLVEMIQVLEQVEQLIQEMVEVVEVQLLLEEMQLPLLEALQVQGQQTLLLVHL